MTCDAEQTAAGACFGGVARIAATVAQMRDRIAAEGGDVSVLDAGDQYRGSLFYTIYKGTEVVEFMAAIGYDAMAVGNHEFDDGPEGLAVLADGVDVPVLSDNIEVWQSQVLSDKVARHTILTVGDQRIGIVSALATDTPETSSPGPSVIFPDDADGLAAAVQDMTDDGVDKIIALTHVGYGRDLKLAAGIDAIAGGHYHTPLGQMEGAAARPIRPWWRGRTGRPMPMASIGAT